MAETTSLAQRPSYGYFKVVLKVSLVGDSDKDFHVVYGDIYTQTHRGEWTSDDFWLSEIRGSYGRGGIRSHNHALYFFADVDDVGDPAAAVFVLQNAPLGPYDRPSAGQGVVKNSGNPCWSGAPLNWVRASPETDDDSSEDAG